jgi:tRNA(His) guanylyltransferase
MKFDDLDRKMRVFETSMDQSLIPGMYVVARLDGRGFTKLTKEKLPFQKPFDERFKNAVIETVQHLMNCGFRIVYGYNESDEISLLFHPDENSFQRKVRKLLSILAGEASAKFTNVIGQIACFDCRLSLLPNENLVVDYFRWRSEDAHRNSLNAWCYWKLREQGNTKTEASGKLSGMSVANKNELLFQLGINYNDLPFWQKRGIGFYYQMISVNSVNQKTGEGVNVSRRKLIVNEELPLNEDYSKFLKELLNSSDK